MLVVACIYEQVVAETVTGVTFNGTALTEHTSSPFNNADGNGFSEDVSVWYLANPDTGGAYDLIATLSGATSRDFVLLSGWYSGVDSVAGAAQDTGTGSTDYSVSITTANDNSMIVAAASERTSDGTPMSSSDSTERQDGATATGAAGTSYALYDQLTGTAGSKTVTVTGSSSSYHNSVVVELVAAAGAPPASVNVKAAMHHYRRNRAA